MLPTVKKQWKLKFSDSKLEAQLKEEGGLSALQARLLTQRGIYSMEEANHFLYPDLKRLHDPFLMKNMKRAVNRLEHAITAKEKILLYGDYDVDGTTSITVMSQFLKKIDFPHDYYIPDRYKEGYGISQEGIEYAHRSGYSLIIAMDCGIRAVSATRLANNYHIDLIICDHHLPEEQLPEAHAILDPLQAHCGYPFKYLSGCGVTFKFIQAYCQKHDLPEEYWYELLDYLVISIAADIVPMTGENRILAHFGLQLLNQTQRPGLLALLSTSQRALPLTISDVVFGMAPLINAAGRMAQASLAVTLLLSENTSDALEAVKQLDYQNKLRREFEKRITEEAKQLFIKQENWEETSSIVLYQPHWHKGVVGIVASRLVEAFHRPTIILTESEGRVVGSARSVRGFDIHQAIGHCEFLLMNYGGHTHAAGLTLSKNNIVAFRDCFEGYVHAHITPEQKLPVLEFSSELDFSEITTELFETLQAFAPFGPGNRNPVFVTKNVEDTGYSRVLKEQHLKLSLKQNDSPSMAGIAFFMGHYSEKVYLRKPFDICYTLGQNKWKGQTNWQLMIKDLKFKE